MSAPSTDCASSVEPLPLRHMQKNQGAWLKRRLPLNNSLLWFEPVVLSIIAVHDVSPADQILRTLLEFGCIDCVSTCIESY